jgi:hypothetical protein
MMRKGALDILQFPPHFLPTFSQQEEEKALGTARTLALYARWCFVAEAFFGKSSKTDACDRYSSPHVKEVFSFSSFPSYASDSCYDTETR